MAVSSSSHSRSFLQPLEVVRGLFVQLLIRAKNCCPGFCWWILETRTSLYELCLFICLFLVKTNPSPSNHLDSDAKAPGSPQLVIPDRRSVPIRSYQQGNMVTRLWPPSQSEVTSSQNTQEKEICFKTSWECELHGKVSSIDGSSWGRLAGWKWVEFKVRKFVNDGSPHYMGYNSGPSSLNTVGCDDSTLLG